MKFDIYIPQKKIPILQVLYIYKILGKLSKKILSLINSLYQKYNKFKLLCVILLLVTIHKFSLLRKKSH